MAQLLGIDPTAPDELFGVFFADFKHCIAFEAGNAEILDNPQSQILPRVSWWAQSFFALENSAKRQWIGEAVFHNQKLAIILLSV